MYFFMEEIVNGERIDLFDCFGSAPENENPEYTAFVNKFKPKKTTDDCYTPPYIYDAVLNFVTKEYNLDGREVVRPFYPGGDYERYHYPENCVVVDNPPFSILAKIIKFYTDREIDYFLFAPALTVISSCAGKANAVITDSSVIYENGANVKTAFVTNMGEYRIHVSSALHEAIETAQKKARQEKAPPALPVYTYPGEVLTAALIQKIASHGQTLRIRKEDCTFIRALDAQREKGKVLFGGGVLLSEKAAAEKAAAEKAAAARRDAIVWHLSEGERMIVSSLGRKK